jgi:hypothetical protein
MPECIGADPASALPGMLMGLIMIMWMVAWTIVKNHFGRSIVVVGLALAVGSYLIWLASSMLA